MTRTIFTIIALGIVGLEKEQRLPRRYIDQVNHGHYIIR